MHVAKKISIICKSEFKHNEDNQIKINVLKKNISTLSEIKVQKLILGWYLFKKYTVIPKKSAY